MQSREKATGIDFDAELQLVMVTLRPSSTRVCCRARAIVLFPTPSRPSKTRFTDIKTSSFQDWRRQTRFRDCALSLSSYSGDDVIQAAPGIERTVHSPTNIQKTIEAWRYLQPLKASNSHKWRLAQSREGAPGTRSVHTSRAGGVQARNQSFKAARVPDRWACGPGRAELCSGRSAGRGRRISARRDRTGR